MGSESALSIRKRNVIRALVAGQSHAQAAKAAGVRATTVSRYLAAPRFRAQLAAAQDVALGGVSRRLQAGANDMLDVLAEMARDKGVPASVRVRAAAEWLAQMWRAREFGELARRLAAIEKVLEVTRERKR